MSVQIGPKSLGNLWLLLDAKNKTLDMSSGYWPFLVGNIYSQTSTALNDLTPSSPGPSFNSDGYWTFNGTSNYFYQNTSLCSQVGSPADTYPLTFAGGSLVAWINLSSTAQVNPLFDRSTSYYSYPTYFYIFVNTGGAPTFRFTSPFGIQTDLAASITISAGSWNQVAFVWNWNSSTSYEEVQLYVNGVSAGFQQVYSSWGIANDSLCDFLIGRFKNSNSGSTSHFNGSMSRIAFYTNQLSSDDVLRDYIQFRPRFR